MLVAIALCGVVGCSGGTRDASNAASNASSTAAIVFDSAEVLSAVSGVGAAPILALAPDGRRASAWVSAPDGGTDGRLHVLITADGSTADAVVQHVLTDPLGPIEPHGEAPPKLAWATRADGTSTLGALYVVGRIVPGRRFPASALRFVKSDDGGRTWSPPATVTDDSSAALGADFGSHNFHALHASPTGTFHVAWLDGRAGKSAVYTTHSTDGGVTWAPNVRVVPLTAPMTEACPCCRTAIASDSAGRVYLAWRAVIPTVSVAAPSGAPAAPGRTPSPPQGHAEHGGGSIPTIRDVVVARSDDWGRTWQAPIRVHADDWIFDGCPHAGPSLAVDQRGTVHIAWWTGKPGTAGVWYAQSSDAAKQFTNVQPLGIAEASQPAHVQLAIQHDVVHVTWDDGTRQVPQIVLRTSRDGGRRFDPAVEVSAAGAAAGFPVMSVGPDADELHIAWSEQAIAVAANAASARPNMRDPKAIMPLPSVGQTRVLMRRGHRGASTVAAPKAARFRPLQVGDTAPSYEASRLAIGEPSAEKMWNLRASARPTVVNIWATWCTACREEMADLQALHGEYASRGVDIVGVSVDRGPSDRVQRFVRGEGLTFPIVHDADGRIESAFGVVGVPETVLIDGAGRVRWKTTGNVHGTLPDLRRAIDAMLAESAAHR
jgi:peroxiredoxin